MYFITFYAIKFLNNFWEKKEGNKRETLPLKLTYSMQIILAKRKLQVDCMELNLRIFITKRIKIQLS